MAGPYQGLSSLVNAVSYARERERQEERLGNGRGREREKERKGREKRGKKERGEEGERRYFFGVSSCNDTDLTRKASFSRHHRTSIIPSYILIALKQHHIRD